MIFGEGMKFMRLKVLVLVLTGMIAVGLGTAGANSCNSLLDHRMVTLQGKPQDLCHYEGKVVLICKYRKLLRVYPSVSGVGSDIPEIQIAGLRRVGFPVK